MKVVGPSSAGSLNLNENIGSKIDQFPNKITFFVRLIDLLKQLHSYNGAFFPVADRSLYIYFS